MAKFDRHRIRPYRDATHFRYEGRNVQYHSQRHRKIDIWERKQRIKRDRRQAK